MDTIFKLIFIIIGGLCAEFVLMRFVLVHLFELQFPGYVPVCFILGLVGTLTIIYITIKLTLRTLNESNR